MTPSQSRAARGLLNWNQDALASAADVSSVTVRNFENEKATPQRATMAAMQRALESAGVEFTNGGRPGVTMKPYSFKWLDVVKGKPQAAGGAQYFDDKISIAEFAEREISKAMSTRKVHFNRMQGLWLFDALVNGEDRRALLTGPGAEAIISAINDKLKIVSDDD